jgi:hypothetical protein
VGLRHFNANHYYFRVELAIEGYATGIFVPVLRVCRVPSFPRVSTSCQESQSLDGCLWMKVTDFASAVGFIISIVSTCECNNFLARRQLHRNSLLCCLSLIVMDASSIIDAKYVADYFTGYPDADG